MKFKVAKILREAYEQNDVLNQSDVSLLIGVSAGTISKDIKEFKLEHRVIKKPAIFSVMFPLACRPDNLPAISIMN